MVSKKLAQRLVKLGQQKTFMDKLKLFKGFSPSELAPTAPANAEPRTGLSMGEHAELMAQEWDITRAEQDQPSRWRATAKRPRPTATATWTISSRHSPASSATTTFARMRPRRSSATLKTAFDKSERGTLTAANSTPLTDGAAAVLLASEEWATKHGLPVQAYLTYSQAAANDFVGGDGLLMAPTIAVSKMLERAGLRLQDFDFYEIHEAFAAQVLATLKAWEDPAYCKEVLGSAEPMGSIDRARRSMCAARPSPSGIRSRRPARASSATSPSCCRSITAAG